MKILVENYTFDASAQTIEFDDYGTIRQDAVLIVTNVTDGIIIYNFADSAKGGSAATNVLTLDYDTTTMADADKLQIWYEDLAQTGDTTDLLTDTELRATAVPTTESVPLTGFALATGQLVDGHNVTVDNAGGVEVVQVTAADLNVTEASAADILADTAAMDTNLAALEGALVGPAAPNIDSYTHASINLAAGANQVLVASAASKQIWVYGIGFTVSAAGSVSFQDEDDLAITGIMTFAASSGLNTPPSGNFAMPIWKLATDKDLEVDIVTADVDGWIDYAIVSV